MTSLENRPMRPKLINRSHPFLIGRIIGVVEDFRDFAQSVSRRLDAFSARVPGTSFLTPANN
jgi:hypothetical protein